MQIREYQQWLEEWDDARSWDKVLLSHIFLHVAEELGEISRLVQMLEGYRSMDNKSTEDVRNELALELSDMQVMLFKIANLCDIDMESALRLGQEKVNRLYPDIEADNKELEAYWQRFHAYMASRDLPKP